MDISALLLGSIGVIAETHDMQRRAFNAAFTEAGLDWEWTDPEYSEMLKSSGGRTRIAAYAQARGETVDAASLHAAKVAHFAKALADEGLTLRPGIADVIDAAKDRGIKVGFVTSTGADQSGALLDALGGAITADTFDFVGSFDLVSRPKPSPDIYVAAMTALGVAAEACVAIEDTPISAQSPIAAGIPTFGYPGIAAQGLAFPSSVEVIDTPSAALLDMPRRVA